MSMSFLSNLETLKHSFALDSRQQVSMLKVCFTTVGRVATSIVEQFQECHFSTKLDCRHTLALKFAFCQPARQPTSQPMMNLGGSSIEEYTQTKHELELRVVAAAHI